MTGQRCPHMHGGGLKLVADGTGQDSNGAFPATLFDTSGEAVASVLVEPGRNGFATRPDEATGPSAAQHLEGYSRIGPAEPDTRTSPLDALAAAMVSAPRPAWPAGSPALPSVYVYFAQFLGHDMSKSTFALPAAPANVNTAALDLDTLFPTGAAQMQNAATLQNVGALEEQDIAIGRSSRGSFDSFNDLPRATDGEPLVPDQRSDANLFIAQIHVALSRWFAIASRSGAADPRGLLTEAVHQITLYDLLPKLVPAPVLEDIMTNGRRLISPGSGDPGAFLIPAEFAFAAYRFGHPMVRNRYTWSNTGPSPHFMPQMLAHTFHGGSLALHDDGHRVLSFRWEADWNDSIRPDSANVAAPITPVLYHELGQLNVSHLTGTPDPANLAQLTLNRGRLFSLSSAQSLAAAHPAVFTGPMLTPDEIAAGQSPEMTEALTDGPAGDRLCDRTPLWYYTLREAQVSSGGARLGPVAGRIVAETLHAAVCAAQGGPAPAHDPQAPTLPALLQFSQSQDPAALPDP